MSFLEPVEFPKPQVSPALFVGAASPLWGYFSGAALSGVAFWWMTRWTQPMNLEALFGGVWTPAEPEELGEITTATLEAAAETVQVVGGEAGPISPVLALAEEPVEAAEAVVELLTEPEIEPLKPEPEPAPEAVAAVAPAEQTSFADLETASEPTLEAAPKPKVKKPAAPTEPTSDLG